MIKTSKVKVSVAVTELPFETSNLTENVYVVWYGAVAPAGATESSIERVSCYIDSLKDQ